MATNTPSSNQSKNGFFINDGTFHGHFTTPGGEHYNIGKLEPREVTDPRDGTVSIIWGGYASARDINRAAQDAILQSDFKRTGERPASFSEESKEIPLYITLRARADTPGVFIATFWNSEANGKGGRHTILAHDRGGKDGLRFGGNVLNYMTGEELAAAREAKAVAGLPEPDEKIASAAHAGAKTRVTPRAEGTAPRKKLD